MNKYVIEYQNRETKEWEIVVEEMSESRKQFLKQHRNEITPRAQWRCRKWN